MFVRLRPLLGQETKDRSAWRAVGDTTLLEEQQSSSKLPLANGAGSQQQAFTYNQVFPDTCDTDAVYASAASPLVKAAMQGFNATVFCYGQTVRTAH